jgi:hypothetical protein
MTLQAEVDFEMGPSHRFTAGARQSSCPAFGDILWPPIPVLSTLAEEPGVMFETSLRVFVLQRICGELRYYAGGWCPDQSRIYLEEDRIAAEGCEAGVFASIRDAMAFAQQYLGENLPLGAIQVLREARYSMH